MIVSPTGSGKAVLIGDIVSELNWPTCVIVHRQELIGQLCLALNREKVPHGIIAPNDVIRQIVALEMDTHGKSYFNARAHVRVAGVHTLIAREAKDRWFKQVQLVIVDEGHHVLKDNIWGEALALFPSARGLFPTAHAIRADGRGLGRGADGFVDTLCVGPSCRTLINRGFLTDYRLICPPSDVDVSSVPISSSGDYSGPKLREAVHKSKTIVGDIARHYLKFAPGKLGLTFAVDIESATEICAAFRANGVAADIITAKTPTHIRAELMKRFRRRDILQLVSVDVLGEGVDVPAIEVVSMARHTASFQLYSQQFGRALRVMVDDAYAPGWGTYSDEQRKTIIAASVKPKAIIIDHVNNWQRHLPLPDVAREYSLDRREKRSRAVVAVMLRTCLECLQPHEAFLSVCPHCGAPRPAPAGRGTVEMVEGNLYELDPEVLKEMRGEIDRVDNAPRIPRNAEPYVAKAIQNRHMERQQAQRTLRSAIALWAGYQKHLGRDDSETLRLFYLTYGIDVASAQCLSSTDSEALELRLRTLLNQSNIIEAA